MTSIYVETRSSRNCTDRITECLKYSFKSQYIFGVCVCVWQDILLKIAIQN